MQPYMFTYTFRFYRSQDYREQQVVIVGSHYEEARVAAWHALAEQTSDRAPRQAWRLVSTMQEPALMEATR